MLHALHATIYVEVLARAETIELCRPTYIHIRNFGRFALIVLLIHIGASPNPQSPIGIIAKSHELIDQRDIVLLAMTALSLLYSYRTHRHTLSLPVLRMLSKFSGHSSFVCMYGVCTYMSSTSPLPNDFVFRYI